MSDSPPSAGKEAYEQQGRTFSLELLRSFPQGFVETAVSTFALFVAIRVFEMPAWMKATIVSSSSVGLLLSLFIVQIVRRSGAAVNVMAGFSWMLAALGFAGKWGQGANLDRISTRTPV